MWFGVRVDGMEVGNVDAVTEVTVMAMSGS